MPLQPPKLDDRDFNSLFLEARSRIHRYLPEWTDWNDSDPGITLLQLQAWLADTILFRLNQLPELNYIKFLQLLGVEQRPARPAQADLTFTLKDNAEAEVLIPQRVLVGVSAADLDEAVFFETDQSFRAISARLDLLLHVPPGGGPPQDVTTSNNADGRSFLPFGDGPAEYQGAYLVLGFTSLLPFPRGEIGLQFYLSDEGQALLSPPQPAVCGPGAEGPDALRLAWEWWDGTLWSDLNVTGDETRNLTQSGLVHFRVTGPVPAQPISQVDLPHPPGEDEESEEEVDPSLRYWLRVRVAQGAYPRPPRLDRVLTNTVRATAAQTVFDEAVASSDGAPNQTMSLRHRPVLADPPLELEVDEGQGPVPWKLVEDFLGSGPHSNHYVLNRATGEIHFGDGQRGRIPLAGQFNVIARSYRYGGGRIGNVGARTITDLATVVSEVDEVTNHRPAGGGADEELLEETKLRGPRALLKTRDRAVTLEDFASLALETPGALVARASAYVAPAGAGEGTGNSNNSNDNDNEAGFPPGGGRVINVVIVPQTEAARPVPSEAAKRMVCKYLDQRRLITTQLVVKGPLYHDIDVVLDVQARSGADLKEVKNAIEDRLSDYFHPLGGGEDGQGWPFGRDVYYAELLREIMVLPGVQRVQDLEIRKLLVSFDTEADAQQAMDGLVQAERAAFPDACEPEGVIVPIVEEDRQDPEEVKRYYYVAAVYQCCDLPVAQGALIALRDAEIIISHVRQRGA